MARQANLPEKCRWRGGKSCAFFFLLQSFCRTPRTQRRQVGHGQQRDDALAVRGVLSDVIARERPQAQQLVLALD